MSQLASSLFNLNLKDLQKGVVMAVIGTFLMIVQQMLTTHGFDFAHYDWQLVFSTSLGAGLTYLMKNFLSDSNGKVMGKIG